MVDLDAKTQKVIISMATKDKVERQNIATTLQQIQTGHLLSGVNAKQIIVESQLTEKQKTRLLNQLGINQAVAQNSTISVSNAIQQISAAKGIGQAKKDELIATLSNIAATEAQTAANNGLATSMKALQASMGWVGWLSIAASFLIPIIMELIGKIKSTKEQLEETAQVLADIRSEEKGLNDELKTTQERIAELEAKGVLSFTDEAELNRLRQENAELERKLILLDDEQKKEEEKYRKKFNKFIGLERQTSDDGYNISLYKEQPRSGPALEVSAIEYLKELGRAYHDAEMAADGYFETAVGTKLNKEQIQKHIDRISDSITDYQKYLSDLYENGFNYFTADEETKKNVDFVNEMIDTYMVVIGKTNTLWSQVYNRDRFAEARTAIEELDTVTVESLQELYNTNPQVKEFVDYLFSLNSTDAKNVEEFLSLLPGEFKKIEEAAESATSNIQTFSDVFKSIKEGTDVLADAYSDIEDGGEISLEHLMSLLDKYPDLVEYVNLENGQHNITIGILKAKFEAEKKAQLAKITASKSAVNAEIAEQKAILDTIATKKEKAKQDMAETMVSIGQFKTVGDALNAINARPGYYLRGFDWDVSDAKVAIADAEKQLKNLSAQEALIKNMSWEDITSGSGSKTEKTAAEKYFDKQKYLLETNQITQEEYLKRINQKYKEFYKNQGDDLENYAKYSQEVYDGFKDMYKEDLEAQKEAWEEKKDAVSEYYDNLREQIEEVHDEEDYEKERDEKRKEIFDLDMRINELLKAARDGSEKAKARIAELEEERLKAEEEYREFESDKAREDELSRLEKEQEAEEKKIQDQIDTIDKELETIDEDIVSVRNAIINYAAKRGVTLDFAYASGTHSSVGGFGRINEKGIEMISAPDGNGNYIPMLPNSYVFSAKATEFLWKLATEHSLPQAMYNSIAKSIKTQSNTPSVNIAQPITITMGDVIIKGNADKQTVFEIKKQRESDLRWILGKLKELQK